MAETCPTCGAAVRVVGHTTKHFEPVAATLASIRAAVTEYGERCHAHAMEKCQGMAGDVEAAGVEADLSREGAMRLVADVIAERDEARAGYRALDKNWAGMHEAAMAMIRTAVGNAEATVPEIVAELRALREVASAMRDEREVVRVGPRDDEKEKHWEERVRLARLRTDGALAKLDEVRKETGR